MKHHIISALLNDTIKDAPKVRLNLSTGETTEGCIIACSRHVVEIKRGEENTRYINIPHIVWAELLP